MHAPTHATPDATHSEKALKARSATGHEESKWPTGRRYSLLPPGVVDSSGKGTVAGGSAAAHSPAPALALLPHIIGLPTMLHATNIKQIVLIN